MRPGPQSPRGTNPIDTAPTAAEPIMVRTTRRERFMGAPYAVRETATVSNGWGQRGKLKRVLSRDRAALMALHIVLNQRDCQETRCGFRDVFISKA
jgi:hypothetical protein